MALDRALRHKLSHVQSTEAFFILFVSDKGNKLFNGHLHAEEWVEPASHGKSKTMSKLKCKRQNHKTDSRLSFHGVQ